MDGLDAYLEMTMKPTTIALIASLTTIAAPACALPTTPITSGDLTFNNFSCTTTGIACAGITATSYVSISPPDPVSGENGIRLTGAFDALPGVSNDTTIIYDAHSAGAPISDASLYYNGTPITSISEQVFDIATGRIIGSLFVTNPPAVFTDHIDLTFPSADVRLVKDIEYIGDRSQGTISIIDQTFSQSTAPVPEPASLLLLGTALLGTGVVVRRRRR